MDDRYRRELTKLHHGEPPADLWDRALEGPRLAPLGPSPRSRVTAAIVAFAVFGLAAGLLWRSFAESGDQPAGSNQMTVPPRGETSAVFLDDGRPVFVVHHEDGTVSVVDGFSSHRAWGVEEFIVWCPSTREFVEAAHQARFDEYGSSPRLRRPAAWRRSRSGVIEHRFGRRPQLDRGRRHPRRHAGWRNRSRPPPFCPAGGVIGDADSDRGHRWVLRRHRDGRGAPGRSGSGLGYPSRGRGCRTEWTGARTGDDAHRSGRFVQLCAQVVDDRCEGGEVVRGVDGVGLMVNVTRFDWVSGYEEPQVWLVQINDGVIDNPAGFGGMRAS